MKPVTIRSLIFIFSAILWIGGFYVLFTYDTEVFYQTRNLLGQKKDAQNIKTNVERIVSLANEVFNQYQGFESPQIKRLIDILPNSSQIPELMLIIPGLAKSAGVKLNQFGIFEEGVKSETSQTSRQAPLLVDEETGAIQVPSQLAGKSKIELGSVKISISVSGTYDQIKNLLTEIEHEARLMDVESINFSTTEKGMTAGLNIKAYFLK